MRKSLLILVAFTAVILFAFLSRVVLHTAVPTDKTKETELAVQSEKNQQDTTERVRAYLNSKKSPLNNEEISLLVQQEHWRLLIAVSAIESQYCKVQLGYNCWGIGGDSAYRYYKNFSEAIIDANNLIDHWQEEHRRWLTVEDMNCHYVQPCNDNWVRVVNSVLDSIKDF